MGKRTGLVVSPDSNRDSRRLGILSGAAGNFQGGGDMATPSDVEDAARLAAVAYDRARSLSMAPLNRWAREWQTFKARAKALRSAPDTAETRAAIAAAALDAAEYFGAEAERHRALSFREKLAALDKDFGERAA